MTMIVILAKIMIIEMLIVMTIMMSMTEKNNNEDGSEDDFGENNEDIEGGDNDDGNEDHEAMTRDEDDFDGRDDADPQPSLALAPSPSISRKPPTRHPLNSAGGPAWACGQHLEATIDFILMVSSRPSPRPPVRAMGGRPGGGGRWRNRVEGCEQGERGKGGHRVNR